MLEPAPGDPMADVLRIAPLITTPIALLALGLLVYLLKSRTKSAALKSAVDKASPEDLPAIVDGSPAWLRDAVKDLPKKDLREVVLAQIDSHTELAKTRMKSAAVTGVVLFALATASWVFRPAEAGPAAPAWQVRQVAAVKTPTGWTVSVQYDADGVRGGQLAVEIAQGGAWGGAASYTERNVLSGTARALPIGITSPPFQVGSIEVRLAVLDGARRVHASTPVSAPLAP